MSYIYSSGFYGTEFSKNGNFFRTPRMSGTRDAARTGVLELPTHARAVNGKPISRSESGGFGELYLRFSY